MFTNEKITQVAACLLKRAERRLNYTAFLKLLYLADKKMLVEWGIPITYDDWFSMPQGPVLSHTYNLIRNPQGAWAEHIRTVGYEIELVSSPGDDLLSDAEENAIDSIFAEHGEKEWHQLIEYTHSLSEWEDPQGSSIPLSYSQVLEVEGFPRDRIEQIVKNIKEEKSIQCSLIKEH